MEEPMEFKAEVIDGKLEVKPIIERKGKDLIIHVPSFPIIQRRKMFLTWNISRPLCSIK